MTGPSVFISSTTRGLATWRDHIAEILRSHGINPTFQTNFTPESVLVRDEITRQITKANGVICLVGPYYGCPLRTAPSDAPPPEDVYPISYTQYEWNLAMNLRKPIKTYLLAEEFFKDKGIESEVDAKFHHSPHFSRWQQAFRQDVKDTGPYVTVRSEVDLALSFARTKWEGWMR